MASTEDRSRFLASDPTRLKIARWCSTEPLSRGEIARRLQRASGSVSAPETMLRRGALIDAGFGDSLVAGRKARLFKLDPKWRKPMEQALRLQRPAVLEPGIDLLLIPLTSTLTACEVLSQGAQEIDWGVQLDGEQAGLLLGPHLDSEGGATIRAVASLEKAGVKLARLRLQTPLAAEELQRWAMKVVGDDKRRLAPGR